MFEFAVEMTYPLPEAISAGLLNFFFQVSLHRTPLLTVTLFHTIHSYCTAGRYWHDYRSWSISTAPFSPLW